MSMASPIPYIKIRNPSSSCSSSTPAPTSCSSCFRFSTTAKLHTVTVMSSQAEGPLRRPVAPPLREPSLPPPSKPVPPSPPAPPTSSSSRGVAPPPPKPSKMEGSGVVTLEFQRQKAKELQEYFKQKKLEESNQGPFFGFLGKNEIANGRWAMFGFAVGLLTEYATGSDLVDQLKILLSNFGILDLE